MKSIYSELTEKTFSSISDLISSYNVTLLNKKISIYDTVSMYLDLSQNEDPLFIVNIGDVIRQYELWMHYLPNIKPFYAIKCNPNPLIMKVLHRLGCGFDCASKNELIKVLGLEVSASDIIFANPVKTVNSIEFARANDVDLTTFDSEHELYKIKLHYPNARLVIRIITDDKDSSYKLSCKFGCDTTEGESLLQLAKKLDLNIVGVSFHVGSGCGDPNAFLSAISDSKKLFECGKNLGYEMKLLDIGGGFPGRDTGTITFEAIANQIKSGLETHFSDWPGLNVISEPGCFFVYRSHTLISRIINKKYKKDPTTGEKSIFYYINDGVYSSFFECALDPLVKTEANTFPFLESNEKKFKCKIFGPTSESIDLISNELELPDLEVGEYMIHTDMGAYSLVFYTGNESFSGFKRPQIKYFIN